MQETLSIMRARGYHNADGELIVLPMPRPSLTHVCRGDAESCCKRRVGSCARAAPMSRDGVAATVHVVCADSVKVALALQDAGFNPLTLNMANAKVAGGGYLRGASAQEESLFRVSTLAAHLDDKPFALPRADRTPLYPIPEYAGVYTPAAIVFRASAAEGFALLDVPRQLAFVAIAAFNRPPLLPSGQLTPDAAEGTREKVRVLFRIARAHGHDTVVAGALGCGAFKNPAAHVAALFRDVLHEPEFAGCFQHVVFAIMEDHNSGPGGNSAPFAAAFGVPVQSLASFEARL